MCNAHFRSHNTTAFNWKFVFVVFYWFRVFFFFFSSPHPYRLATSRQSKIDFSDTQWKPMQFRHSRRRIFMHNWRRRWKPLQFIVLALWLIYDSNGCLPHNEKKNLQRDACRHVFVVLVFFALFLFSFTYTQHIWRFVYLWVSCAVYVCVHW